MPSGSDDGDDEAGRRRRRNEDEEEVDVYYAEEEDDAEVAPIRIGDLVSMRHLGATKTGGFISAEGVLDNDCLVDEKPNQFDQCVFQVRIQNQYSALKEYVENVNYLEELQNEEAAEKKQDTLEGDVEKLSKLLGTLELAMDNERALNEAYMKSSIGNQVHLGDVVQLFHVKSNKYLTVEATQVAFKERENLRVSLSEYGSSLSWFTVVPAFKIDREGEPCVSGANVVLHVTERPGEHVHCSEAAIGGDEDEIDGDNDARFKEVNCSLERSAWRLMLYSQFYDDSNPVVRCGDVVRLVEPELNSYLRIIDLPPSAAGNAEKSVCVLTPQQQDSSLATMHSHSNASHLDSTSLWIVEGYHRPAVGGPLCYESRSYRLRHLNSGKYLAMRASELWRKSINLTIALKTIGGRPPRRRESIERSLSAEEMKHEFTAVETSLLSHCAIFMHQPQVAGQRKAKQPPGGGPTKLRGSGGQLQIMDNSPIQIECQGRWLHCGNTVEDSTDVLSAANATRNGTLSLVVQRAASGSQTAITYDILVGVAAIPRLKSFKSILSESSSITKKLHDLDLAEASFVEVIDQLTNFLLQRSLQEVPDYPYLAKYPLQDNIPFERQMLLCEQGVLKEILDILDSLQKLADEVVTKLGGDTSDASFRLRLRNSLKKGDSTSVPMVRSRRVTTNMSGRKKKQQTSVSSGGDKGGEAPPSEIEAIFALQDTVAVRAFWVLNLATRDNSFIQMQVADDLSTFVAYAFKEPIATRCLTHMLATNQAIQDTKVSDSHAHQIVQMMRGGNNSDMRAEHLDMLRALCACNGRGVGSNQSRVVDIWLDKASECLIHLVELTEPASGEPPSTAAKWTLGGQGFPKPPEHLRKYVLGNELLDGVSPALHLQWSTSVKDLAPGSFTANCDSTTVVVESMFQIEKRRSSLRRASSLGAQKAANRKRVARFFIAQLYLLGELCLDRNYLAIELVQRAMPFTACLSLVINKKLPNNLKAAVVRIISTVYVDRDPSSRSRVPHLCHNWSEIAENKNSARPEIPEQQRISFLLLQDVIDQYLVRMAKGNSWDAFKQRMMELLLKLVQFGYYSSTEEMQRLVRPLVKDLSNQCVDLRTETKSAGAEKQGNMSSRRLKADKSSKHTAQVFPADALADDRRSSYFYEEYDEPASGDGGQADEISLRQRCDWQRWCKLEPHPDSWQARVYDVMDGIVFVLCVLVVVCMMLIFWLLDVPDITFRDSAGFEPLAVVSFLCTLGLIFEVTFRWYCYSHKYGMIAYFVYDPESLPFNVIDLLLAFLDVLVVTGIFGNGAGGFRAGKALRVIKLVRAVRAAKAINKLSLKPEEPPEPNWVLPARYYSTPAQKVETMREVVMVLGEVSLLHRDNNLAALFAAFKRSFQDRISQEPRRMFSEVVDRSPRLATLAAPVLEDRRAVAGVQHRFDEILLDLCLYRDENLVQSVLNLLMAQHSARDSLIKDMYATQLIFDSQGERQALRLRRVTQDLQSAVERHELWGNLKTEGDKRLNEEVKSYLCELTQACMERRSTADEKCAYKPTPHVQTLLFNLGALDAAMTVMRLHVELDEIDEATVRENVCDILRLCCVFLQWLVKDHKPNQIACFDHIDTFVLCFDHDVGAPCVVAEIIRGNSELTKAFPTKVIAECAIRIVAGGRDYTYLKLLEALLCVGSHSIDAKNRMQFTVLRELSMPTRAEKILWLCRDSNSLAYAERVELMRAETDALAKSGSTLTDMTPDMDRSYMPDLLRYHCALLDVLSACAIGNENITTVEAKLQNLITPDEILSGLLDDHTSLSVRNSLAALLLEVVVDVETVIPDFEKSVLLWRYLSTVPEALKNLSRILLEHPDDTTRSFAADGPPGIQARLTLRHAFLLIKTLNSLFERYLTGPSALREVRDCVPLAATLNRHWQRSNSGRRLFPEHYDAEDALDGESRRDFTTTASPDDLQGAESGRHFQDDLAEQSSRLIRAGSISDDDVGSPLSDASSMQAANEESDAWFKMLMPAIQESGLALLGSECANKQLPFGTRSALYRMLELISVRVKLEFDEEPPSPQNKDFDENDGYEDLDEDTNRQVTLSPLFSNSPAQTPTEDTPRQAFKRFLRTLKARNDSYEDEQDKVDIVESFEMLKSRYDPFATADLRIEPLIEKLVEHTLGRMKPSFKGMSLDEECTKTTRWLVQVLRTMIEKKWGMTIHQRNDEGGEEQDLACYELQKLLNSCGVTKLCLKLIVPGIDRELVLEATKLCVALLFREGGNQIVQTEIHKTLSGDCELFFMKVRNTLAEIKREFMTGDLSLFHGENVDVPVPRECIMMRLIQLMSEGHYEPNQSIMREQPGHSTNINLLDDLVDLISSLSRDKRRCRRSTKTALQACSTLLEFVQGPCKPNQRHLAIHTELVEILNRITRSKPIRDCKPDEDDDIKHIALETYEGLLEGESGESVVVTRIISVIDLNVLKSIIELPQDYNAVPGEQLQHPVESDLSPIQIECLVLFQMFFDFQPSLREAIQLPPRIQRLLMGRRVTSVEVVWNGRTIRRFFPVPPICEHISDATRQKLVTDIDRSSDETRLQEFQRRAHDIFREISHQAVLESIQFGRINLAHMFSRTNQEFATWLAFVVALVINTILLWFAEHDAGRLAQSKSSIWHGNAKHVQLILFVLNIFNIALSSFTLVLFVVVRCPVKYLALVEHEVTDGRQHPRRIRALMLTALDRMTVYYLVYTILSALALEYRFCSSLLLLDIVVKDATSADVINAIVYPRRQLAATMMLASIVVYIFSVLIFEQYAHQFDYEGDEEDGDYGNRTEVLDYEDEDGYLEDCRSLKRCFAVTAMYGMRLSGGIGDILTHTWSARLWVDFLYFFIVLIVLLNVVFGVIVDTFSDLRSRKKERLRSTLANCFICGLDNMTFDRIAPGGFRRHIHEDHYMWNYLNFIIFIWLQDRDEDDGLEQNVREQIAKNDIAWFPIGHAICLTDENPEATMSEKISDLQASIERTMAANEKRLTSIIDRSTDVLRQYCEHNAQRQVKRIDQLEQRIDHLCCANKSPIMASAKPVGNAVPQLSTPPELTPPRTNHIKETEEKKEDSTVLSVRIHSATDLIEGHLLGPGDPFVCARVMSGDQVIGETERVALSLARWTSTIQQRSPTPGPIRVEIWHCTRQGPGYFLGQTELYWTEIEAGLNTTRRLEHAPRGATLNIYVQGNVEITANLSKSTPARESQS